MILYFYVSEIRTSFQSVQIYYSNNLKQALYQYVLIQEGFCL